MPWTAADAESHTKKAGTSAKRKQWAATANSARAACIKDGGSAEDCDAMAIRVATAGLSEADGPAEKCVCPDCDYTTEKERGTPCRSMNCPDCGAMLVAGVAQEESMNIGELAKTALEIGLAAVNKSSELTQEQATVALRKLQGRLDEMWQEGDIAPISDAIGAVEPMTEVEETAPMTWATSFSDLDAEKAAQDVSSDIREMTYQFRDLVSNIMFYAEVTSKPAAIRALTEEFVGRIETVLGAEMPEADITEQFVALGEVADYDGDVLAEYGVQAGEGRRAPVVIDFQVLKPGPGNKRDGHYYPASVVERDIHVFEGATVFATDHKEAERSERTKVGKVLACPTRFNEGAPVAQVLIYDPNQAEKARNRADSGALDTLECSIYGTGSARVGEVDGHKYKVVESITEGKYLELVSSAGAGGKALRLAELDAGGETMTKETKVEAAEEEVQEVSIEETEAQAASEETTEAPATEPEAEEATEPEPEATAESLAESDVTDALAESDVPEPLRKYLVREYADKAALDTAIAEAVADVKKLTGSGTVQNLGESAATEAEPMTVEEFDAKGKANFNAIMDEEGMALV